jgi:hypothetical protein
MDRFDTPTRPAAHTPAASTLALTLALAASAAAMLPVGAAAQAQAWPVKPVRVIFPYPPGGGTDAVGRIATNALTLGSKERRVFAKFFFESCVLW